MNESNKKQVPCLVEDRTDGMGLVGGSWRPISIQGKLEPKPCPRNGLTPCFVTELATGRKYRSKETTRTHCTSTSSTYTYKLPHVNMQDHVGTHDVVPNVTATCWTLVSQLAHYRCNQGRNKTIHAMIVHVFGAVPLSWNNQLALPATLFIHSQRSHSQDIWG